MREKHLTRIAWVGGAALILMLTVGFWNCATEMPVCTKDPCWREWLRCGWASINSPVVLGLAALVVSVIGLGTWRAQVRATALHDVARKVLGALLSLEDAIALARHELEVIKEFRRGAHFFGGPPEHLQGKNPQHVAQAYGGPVWTARDHLQKAEADAVAVIGEEAREQLIPVFRAVDWFMRRFAYEWNPNVLPEVGEERRQLAKTWGVQPDALYGATENDQYAKQLGEAMKGARDYYWQFVGPKPGRDGR